MYSTYRSLKTIIVLLLFIGFCGCDLLENQKPQQSIEYTGEIKINQLQNLTVGLYDDLQQYTSYALIFNTLIGVDAVYTGSQGTYKELNVQGLNAGLARIATLWNRSYKAINDANIVLDNVSSIKGSNSTQGTIDNISGQAFFIRALTYFYLVNGYALPSGATSDDSQLGVPLQLKPVYNSEDFQKPKRSSVSEVYDQIESDLKKAEELTSPTNAVNKITPSAAMALRARIALIRHNYPKAADLSGEIIKSKKFNLLPKVTTYFRDELSAESIFELQNTVQDGQPQSLSNLYNINGRDDIQINITMQNKFNSLINDRQQKLLTLNGATAIDTRKRDLINGKDKNGNLIVRKIRSAYTGGESNTFKYEDGINASDNAPILRYAEVILTRAEALAHTKGINKESIELLNEIRERAFTVNGGKISLIDYKATDFASPKDLIDAIFLERRVELSYEGLDKTDLQRLKMDVRELPWNSDKLVYPIPQSQIDADDNITQNPGY